MRKIAFFLYSCALFVVHCIRLRRDSWISDYSESIIVIFYCMNLEFVDCFVLSLDYFCFIIAMTNKVPVLARDPAVTNAKIGLPI